MCKKKILKILKKHIILTVITIMCTLFISFTSFSLVKTKLNENKVYKNIYIDNLNLSKLSKEEVKYKLHKYYNEKLKNINVNFYFGEFKEIINAKDLGIYYNIDKISDEIINLGKTGNIVQDTISRLNILLNSKSLTFYPIDNNNKLDYKVKEIASLINKDMIDSSIKFVGENIKFTKSSIGYKVDEALLKEILLESINSNINSSSTINIKIPVNILKPSLPNEILEKFKIIGTYTTSLGNSSENRKNNLKLFTQSLNTKIIFPNEIFSADKISGHRTIAKGYKPAPGFIGDKIVQVPAGGICQGVTTLYNATLYADLEIVERASHSLIVRYAPMGRDATISDGTVDFKFKNNKSYPIIIQTYTNNDIVRANIWGIKENANREIVIDVKHLSPKSCETYKYTYEKGVLIKKEIISRDKYK
ncbi:VanW family protein [Clostridium tarantellae]|uniref:YoaR-like putative peptidoglycan binding domain-containing protein n=1 Tax=Clostridium tarantellae TaxID=39493 RepID=A0A6I1MMJ7_9CLOT|nr:VanW family protein [Clostridium tarantellae]MPQ44615.1 hypothetical protein [Clostridium tarantellae]